MKAIRSWRDLEDFGIDALTGEACGYAMRLLCDVTESGKALIESFFGGRIELTPGGNWNRGSDDDPHVGSVLLPRSILRDLAAFCLLRDAPADSMVALMRDQRDDTHGYPARYDAEDIAHLRELWDGDGAYIKDESKSESFETLFEKWHHLKVIRYYKRAAHTVVARNRHQMSGRTE